MELRVLARYYAQIRNGNIWPSRFVFYMHYRHGMEHSLLANKPTDDGWHPGSHGDLEMVAGWLAGW